MRCALLELIAPARSGGVTFGNTIPFPGGARALPTSAELQKCIGRASPCFWSRSRPAGKSMECTLFWAPSKLWWRASAAAQIPSLRTACRACLRVKTRYAPSEPVCLIAASSTLPRKASDVSDKIGM